MAEEWLEPSRTPQRNMAKRPAGRSGLETVAESVSGGQQPDRETVWQEKYLRLAADLENTKKRLARAATRDVEAQKEALLRDVLPVADALDLAFMHASREEDNRSILQGIDLIRDMLSKFFTKYDVTVIDAWGEPFDPRWHEALGAEHHPKVAPNTIMRVERKGYMHGDKLLRPAQVVVAKR